MSARAMTWSERESVLWRAPELLLRPLQLALNFPAVIFLATLAIFLFKPPDLNLHHADRIAFAMLAFVVGLRTLALRERMPFIARFSLPMLALIVLATLRAGREPFDAQTWSLVASKFIVPFALFHLAILVFRGVSARANFELFVILTLAYLIFTALAFLAGARGLIFPSFILDENIGFHFDRARGPFLQAVANGVSLNLLGLLATTVSGRVKRSVVLVLWVALPWAVLATMTRSVWIGFAASSIVLGFRLTKRPLGQSCLLIAVIGLAFLVGVGAGSRSLRGALSERTEESGPVTARMAVYEAGWSMIQERPFSGWPPSSLYRELARRMQGYRLQTFYVHNTYLALLLEFGWPGLVLYGILFFHLFRLAKDPAAAGHAAKLGRTGNVPQGLKSYSAANLYGTAEAMLSQPPTGETEVHFISNLRKVWPLMLGVFLFNACFVDMAYQFVIGFLFSVAGMLCSQVEAARP